MNHKEIIRQEVREAIEEFLRDDNLMRYNKINVGDFEAASTTDNLKEVENTMNRLIEKHKGFAEFRKKKRVYEGLGVG
jgi:hypothetical protein